MAASVSVTKLSFIQEEHFQNYTSLISFSYARVETFFARLWSFKQKLRFPYSLCESVKLSCTHSNSVQLCVGTHMCMNVHTAACSAHHDAQSHHQSTVSQ